MTLFNRILLALILSISVSAKASFNQTDILDPVLPETGLPFTLEVEIAPFSLPSGLQSYAFAIYEGKWLLLAGRTNGVHGFSDIGNNFPPLFQNTTVYVVDPETGASISRKLDLNSGLTLLQIDALSVTASQFIQKGSTLYIVGGYGINSVTGEMETKSTMTALDLDELIQWVQGTKPKLTKALRQVSHPILQVTGGALFQADNHEPFLLTLGQNFQGLYRSNSNGIYTKQIRTFWLNDNGKELIIFPHVSKKTFPDYRRRDLNVVPIIRQNEAAYLALSGVFTEQGGIWTVPITIFPDGSSFESNPLLLTTFKQAMNNYDCPAFGLYSTSTKEMFVVLPGGLSYGYFSGGTFQTDTEIPFINQITTIKIDQHDNYTQHLMNDEYPFIASTGTNPGNQLLFGAEAEFFIREDIDTFTNGVIELDEIKKPTVIGYIVGGIMSTLPNTVTIADSTSSPYVFTVKVIPK